ncbi:MAG: aminotransferase class I/II-fold pyridoxal phosphate-dependent enzyme [Candidatus Omnitrophica bacterium]|nr:aminotransferase class I/II-fold pyridoxal phosphate-dependent enzyme [Candidatus Omnitrophota bacterium]
MLATILDLHSPSVFIGKQGNGVISFGSGQPDLPPPREAVEDIDIRKDLRYGLIQGEPALREKLSKEYPNSTADNFVITNGASEALDLVFRSISPGKVLVPRPYYYSYPPIIKLAGMEPVYTDLVGGRIDIDDFKKKVKGCKAVLINSPSNPTGCVEAIETLKEIEKVTADLGVYVISDEVYKDLIYERENYYIKGEHVITVNSFSKTYAMCGVRVGYLWSSDQRVADDVIKIKTHTSMNTNLVGQDMALRAMSVPRSYIRDQQEIWRRRRDFIYKGFRELGFELWRPEGAFYILPRCANAREFVSLLYNEYKVIVYLGEWFGAPDHIRLSYALDMSEIEEGLSRIKDAMKKVRCF